MNRGNPVNKHSCLIRVARQLMAEVPSPDREPGHRFYHGQRVAALSREIARRERLSDRVRPVVLFAGALFHDLGKCLDSSGDDHGVAGAREARKHLQPHLAPRQLDAVHEIIQWHNKREQSPNDLCLEGLLVQDADLLDHFGCLEIWLHFYRAARNSEAIEYALEIADSRENASWREYARNHLNFPSSRSEFASRMQRAEQFYKMLKKERAGRLTFTGHRNEPERSSHS